MRKLISITMATVLLASTANITAFAHGGNHRSGNRANLHSQHELCSVDGCEVVGAHQHGDEWFCSQTGYNGSYETCTVSGCTELGLHEHNGEYYYCQSHNSQNGCRRGGNRR